MFYRSARTRILVALLAGASTGLNLVRCRAARRGAVYVFLSRLEDEGLISSYLSVGGSRLYALSATGRDAAFALVYG